ncbi:hypothetical protein PUN28_013127 [Cardiocondyla obscurior]|uniref:Ribosomal protein L2 n=1 Tax=Cardiocondyla obscurior TaxID=286306 RepID=A0AAW2F9L0_9HYME
MVECGGSLGRRGRPTRLRVYAHLRGRQKRRSRGRALRGRAISICRFQGRLYPPRLTPEYNNSWVQWRGTAKRNSDGSRAMVRVFRPRFDRRGNGINHRALVKSRNITRRLPRVASRRDEKCEIVTLRFLAEIAYIACIVRTAPFPPPSPLFHISPVYLSGCVAFKGPLYSVALAHATLCRNWQQINTHRRPKAFANVFNCIALKRY